MGRGVDDVILHPANRDHALVAFSGTIRSAATGETRQLTGVGAVTIRRLINAMRAGDSITATGHEIG